MDTVTQALLGATVGQACFSRKLGRKAVWWGAVAGLLPDLDVLMIPPALLFDPMAEWLYHRAETHALWFGLVFGPLLGLLVYSFYCRRYLRMAESARDRWHERAGPNVYHPGERSVRPAWIGLFVLVLFTHPLLDLFTSYGTQLFAPFSRQRIAYDAVPIVAPLYTLLLLIALVAGRIHRQKHKIVKAAAWIALLLSTAYLFYGLWLNDKAERLAAADLARQQIETTQIDCYPILFQLQLRRAVVRTPTGVCVGAMTLLKGEALIDWECFELPDHPFVDLLERTREGRIFTWFAMNRTAAKVWTEDGQTIVELSDLRYGFPGAAQLGAWGIRGQYGVGGNRLGEIERFQRYPHNPGRFLSWMWRATFGLTQPAERTAGLEFKAKKG